MRNVTRNAQGLRAESEPANGRPVKDHGTGRQCVECSAVLSRYNKGPNCFLHTPKEYVNTGGRPIRKTGRRKGLCPKHRVVHYTGVRHIA